MAVAPFAWLFRHFITQPAGLSRSRDTGFGSHVQNKVHVRNLLLSGDMKGIMMHSAAPDGSLRAEAHRKQTFRESPQRAAGTRRHGHEGQEKKVPEAEKAQISHRGKCFFCQFCTHLVDYFCEI